MNKECIFKFNKMMKKTFEEQIDKVLLITRVKKNKKAKRRKKMERKRKRIQKRIRIKERIRKRIKKKIRKRIRIRGKSITRSIAPIVWKMSIFIKSI